MSKYLSELRQVAPIAWFGFSIISIFFSLTLLILSLSSPEVLNEFKYSMYSATPQVLGSSSTDILADSPDAMRIDRIFQKYNCPLTGYGHVFVEEAQKNDIPYWLVASIAFQESSCGKFVPFKDGEYTYNYYGWGVWGTNVTKFDSVEHGIGVVSKYMADTFFSKGVTEPCEIMRVYTPPSKGSWCNGVKFFRDEIVNYETN